MIIIVYHNIRECGTTEECALQSSTDSQILYKIGIGTWCTTQLSEAQQNIALTAQWLQQAVVCMIKISYILEYYSRKLAKKMLQTGYHHLSFCAMLHGNTTRTRSASFVIIMLLKCTTSACIPTARSIVGRRSPCDESNEINKQDSTQGEQCIFVISEVHRLVKIVAAFAEKCTVSKTDHSSLSPYIGASASSLVRKHSITTRKSIHKN
jgi:hypothetical protein